MPHLTFMMMVCKMVLIIPLEQFQVQSDSKLIVGAIISILTELQLLIYVDCFKTGLGHLFNLGLVLMVKCISLLQPDGTFRRCIY
jgi:hypothetical protein